MNWHFPSQLWLAQCADRFRARPRAQSSDSIVWGQALSEIQARASPGANDGHG